MRPQVLRADRVQDTPLDKLVSLAEAVQLTLRVAYALETASNAPGSATGEDLFVFHIAGSRHRASHRQLFVQVKVGARKDGTGRVFHSVGATLYLTSEAHHFPNLVPEDLVGVATQIVAAQSSTFLAAFSASPSHPLEPRELLLSVVESLLAGVERDF